MISKGFLSASQFLRISKISSSDGSEFNHLLSAPEIQGYKIGKSLGISIGNEFSDTLQSTQFSSIWRTSNISTGSSAANQVTLPLVSTGTYSFVVNWGDGTSDTITTWNQAQKTHTYTLEGIYDIVITGTIIGFSFYNGTTGVGDRLKLLSIRQWGTNFRLGNNAGYFWGCSNLDLSIVRDVLDLTGTTNFGSIFRDCFNITTINRINEWNTLNITNMGGVFLNCIKFNQDIGSWNTSNVTAMNQMFQCIAGTGIFNQNIGNWNTSKVTLMNGMFQNQTQFDQDLGNWNTSNVTNLGQMFQCNTPSIGNFNQNISNWNTSKVTLMNGMFQNQPRFNQDISTKVVTINGVTYTAWDTLNVTNISFIFNNLIEDSYFNQSISNWNTSNVSNVTQMFTGCPYFNQDISTKVVTVGASTYTAWNTLNVTNMTFMFYSYASPRRAGDFNQNIGNWNTSKVTNISSMFTNQKYFNQDISTKVVTVGASTYTAWDILNVTTLSGIFANSLGNSGSFNQNIGNWNTSKVTTISGTFQNQPLFNQDISTKVVTVGASTYTAWDTLNITNMRYVFYNNLSNTTSQFNQNIGNWNTTKVTDMTAMFFNVESFDQNIGNWNVSLVTAFNSATSIIDNFAENNGLSNTNYDSLLIGWASRSVLPNRVVNFGTTKYTSVGEVARNVLTSTPNNWTIVDGGLI